MVHLGGANIDMERDSTGEDIIPEPNAQTVKRGEQNNLVPIQCEICPLLFRLTAFVLLESTLRMCSPFKLPHTLPLFFRRIMWY